MTTKNIRGPSIEGDPYYTPEWCVEQCLDHIIPVVCPNPRTIMEPGAGGGMFVKMFRRAFPSSVIHALDIDTNAGPWPEADLSLHVNYLGPPSKIPAGVKDNNGIIQPYDLTVGNPPYTYAMDFIDRALASTESLVFLLRQGFLSSDKRNDFFTSFDTKPSYVWIIPNRPQFLKNKKHGDSADYCWVCWGGPNQGNDTILRWLPSVSKEVRKQKP